MIRRIYFLIFFLHNYPLSILPNPVLYINYSVISISPLCLLRSLKPNKISAISAKRQITLWNGPKNPSTSASNTSRIPYRSSKMRNLSIGMPIRDALMSLEMSARGIIWGSTRTSWRSSIKYSTPCRTVNHSTRSTNTLISKVILWGNMCHLLDSRGRSQSIRGLAELWTSNFWTESCSTLSGSTPSPRKISVLLPIACNSSTSRKVWTSSVVPSLRNSSIRRWWWILTKSNK